MAVDHVGLTNYTKNLVLEQLGEPATLPTALPRRQLQASTTAESPPRRRRSRRWRHRVELVAAVGCGTLLVLGVALVVDFLASERRVRLASVVLQAAGVVLTVSGLGLQPRQRFIYASADFMTDEDAFDWWDTLLDRYGNDAVVDAVERTGYGLLITPSLQGAVRRRHVRIIGLAEERRQRIDRDHQERRARQVADDDIRTDVDASIAELVESLRPRERTWLGVVSIIVGVALGGFPGEVAGEARELGLTTGTHDLTAPARYCDATGGHPLPVCSLRH